MFFMMLFDNFFVLVFIIHVTALCNCSKSVDSFKRKENVSNKNSTSALKKESGFFVGRVMHGYYVEYSEINTFLHPKMAVEKCEGDVECAGFTYAGAKSVGQPFYIYFFRYVAPPSISVLSVRSDEKVWTSYWVKRNFVIIPGRTEKKRGWIMPYNITKAAKSFCSDILTIMSIQNDEKRISMANKIKWVKFQDKIHEEIPEVKAMTIDPHLANKDSPRSVVEMYEDKDVIKLQDFNCRDKDVIKPKDWNCSFNKTKHLTILRLHPSIIRDPEKPKRLIIKVIFVIMNI